MEGLGFKLAVTRKDNSKQMERYHRNILIEGFGEEGQRKLKASSVLVVGAGGLGSPVILYLAAAGIGTIGIVDNDLVALSNLQRQILHHTNDVQSNKTASAQRKIHALNPEVKVVPYVTFFTATNAETLITPYDFVVDCCDNYTTKFLINDICVKLDKPYSHGAVLALQGEVMTIVPGSACYRCAFPEAPEDGSVPTAAEAGILGAVAGIIGSIQATEVIKYLTGVGELLTNQLLIVQARTFRFYPLKVKRAKYCCCQKG